MATNTTLLTRRSFSTWLAVSGFALTTAQATSAENSHVSEQPLPFGEPSRPSATVADDSNVQERWRAAENEIWQWYERESFLHDQWKLTGITTPVHRETGESLETVPGYLDESLVPAEYRRSEQSTRGGHPVVVRSEPPLGPNSYGPDSYGPDSYGPDSYGPNSYGPDSYGQVSFERRAQDGRPPSEWLLSMEVEELRDWLAKIEVSEAGVQGMTFWTHLTRDHMFRPLLIKGLTEVEQAKLHSAAHFGY